MNVSTGFLKAWIIAIFVLALSGCPKDEQFLVVNATGMSLDIIGDDHVVTVSYTHLTLPTSDLV